MAIDYQNLANGMNFLSNLTNPYGVQKHEIITVNGYQEARDFKLNRGERVALVDVNDDILYIKECSEIGKYSLKVFECKNVTDKYEQQNTPANISREEFENLSGEISRIKQLLEEKSNGKHNVQQ